MSVVLEFCFGNKEATQFHFWEYINVNQTFTYIGFSPALQLQCRLFLFLSLRPSKPKINARKKE